jgi:hypothetical protein
VDQSGAPVSAPLDEAYFRTLRPAGPLAPTAPMPRVSPSALPTPEQRRGMVALRGPVAPKPDTTRRTASGVRVVDSFFADPDFAGPLREFVRTVHHRAAEMASAFDAEAARIEHAHDLGAHFAAARRDGAALAAGYAEGGTASMADLVTQVRARIVADALAGGAR